MCSKKTIFVICFVVTLTVLFFHNEGFAQSQIRTVPSGSYPTIQSAIDASSDGDGVRVLAGTYNEDIDFDQKAIAVFSVDGKDDTIINGSGTGTVVTMGSGISGTARLEGFTIQNGYAYWGGGILIEDHDPIIKDNWIKYNFAAREGGGIYLEASEASIDSNTIEYNEANDTRTSGDDRKGKGGGICAHCLYGVPGIINNHIGDNEAYGDQWGLGAGIYMDGISETSDINIYHNWIYENVAGDDDSSMGGGIYILGADTDGGNGVGIDNNYIRNNEAACTGGGIYLYIIGDSTGTYDMTIVNNLILGNIADWGGAGIFFDGSDYDGLVYHNTIIENDASDGGDGGGIYLEGSLVTIDVENSIIWDNLADVGESIYDPGNRATVNYTDIEGGWGGSGGTGILNTDPWFVADDPYHRLLQNSPCVEAGANNMVIRSYDFEGHPRISPDEGDTDMGWDEYVSG